MIGAVLLFTAIRNSCLGAPCGFIIADTNTLVSMTTRFIKKMIAYTLSGFNVWLYVWGNREGRGNSALLAYFHIYPKIAFASHFNAIMSFSITVMVGFRTPRSTLEM